jgi:hypothetical protein
MLALTAVQIARLFGVGRFSRTVRDGSGEPSYVIDVSRFAQCPIIARRMVVWAVCVISLTALASMAQAQGQAARFSQRLLALQQQNALQQQQSAVQNAAQQTAILVQAAPQQNGMTLQSINFQQQQVALRIAIQQTLALLQTGQQGNAALSRTALGQLNTLQLVLQQSIILQNALQIQSNQLTPEQLLVLSQEQRTLSSLLTPQPVLLPNKTPGGRTH